jgi:hypothetical protein
MPLPWKDRGGGPASEKTLRDEFAKTAMKAILLHNPKTIVWDVAAHAYLQADAMLAERDRRNTQEPDKGDDHGN